MGAGFALFVSEHDASRCIEIARAQGVDAWLAGTVGAGAKRLDIEPLAIALAPDDLKLR